MPYLIETYDDPSTAHVRQQQYQAHLDFLSSNAVLLLACGAKLSDEDESADGGIYLVDLDSRDDAQAFIDSDPFSQHGLFEKVEIRRWRKAYLDGRCHL
jgi:uncharacterized protein YciI